MVLYCRWFFFLEIVFVNNYETCLDCRDDNYIVDDEIFSYNFFPQRLDSSIKSDGRGFLLFHCQIISKIFLLVERTFAKIAAELAETR